MNWTCSSRKIGLCIVQYGIHVNLDVYSLCNMPCTSTLMYSPIFFLRPMSLLTTRLINSYFRPLFTRKEIESNSLVALDCIALPRNSRSRVRWNHGLLEDAKRYFFFRQGNKVPAKTKRYLQFSPGKYTFDYSRSCPQHTRMISNCCQAVGCSSNLVTDWLEPLVFIEAWTCMWVAWIYATAEFEGSVRAQTNNS